jgi:hypothetical protein
MVRTVRAALELHFPGALGDLRILPISTAEWTSELRTFDGISAIIFDLEQVNALDFLCAHQMAVEHPIFHFNEYLIRAAELLLGLGEDESAIRIANVNFEWLVRYSQHHKAFPAIPRPMSIVGLLKLPDLLESTTPAFLLGHEIGHYLSDRRLGPTEWFSAIEGWWRKAEVFEMKSGPAFARFIVPSILQKLDDNGLPCGNIVFGTKLMASMKEIQQSLIAESQADFVAIYVATIVAAKNKIDASDLFTFLLCGLVGLEQHLILRRLVERLPRSRERAAIELEFSRLHSRIFMLGRIIHAIRTRELEISKEISTYWRGLPRQIANQISSSMKLEKLSNRGELSHIVARGGVYLGSGGPYPSHLPTSQELKVKYGPGLSGTMAALHAPFHAPKEIYDIGGQFDWSPEKDVDPSVVGFASAIREITSALSLRTEVQPAFSFRPPEGRDLLDWVRCSRICIVGREFDVEKLEEYGIAI